MEKHYYRTLESSELGRLLRKFLHDCDTAERQADNYCQKAGAQTFYGDESHMAGGVLCLGFGDQQPDKKLWRSIGKDGDGLEMYEPNCQRRQDCIILPRSDFRPSDTATRIYQRRACRWQDVAPMHTHDEWMRIAGLTPSKDADRDRHRLNEKMAKEAFCRYTELYYDDEQDKQVKASPRYRMPLYCRRAIRLEYDRLRLPVVSIQSLFSILRADLTFGQQRAIVQPVTPIIFLHYGRYYIAIDYPCSHPDLEQIEQGQFAIKRGEAERLLRQDPS